MKTTLLFYPVILFMAMSSVVFSQECPENDGSTWCSTQRSQLKYEFADDNLNKIYRKLLKTMEKPAGEYLDYPSLKKKFIESQRQWIRFRDTECDAWYILNEAGTGRNVDHLECLVMRTHDRIKQLKEWQSAMP